MQQWEPKFRQLQLVRPTETLDACDLSRETPHPAQKTLPNRQRDGVLLTGLATVDLARGQFWGLLPRISQSTCKE